MEEKLTLHAAAYLLSNHFVSKKSMAIHLGISYRALLRLCNGHSSQHDTQNIMIGIARYCMQEHIPPEQLFREFAPM